MSFVRSISLTDWSKELLEKYIEKREFSKFICELVEDNLGSLEDRRKLFIRQFTKLQKEGKQLGFEIEMGKEPK